MGYYSSNLVSLAMIILSILSGGARSDQSLLKLPSENTAFSDKVDFDIGGRKLLRPSAGGDWTTTSFCESWKFSVENNDAGPWSPVPQQCGEYVENYMNGGRYSYDSWIVAKSSLDFATNISKSSSIAGDNDCWVFDVDDTLLSSLDYYKDHGYGTEPSDRQAISEWMMKGKASAIPASLALFNQLKGLGFKIIVLTGRDEDLYRNATEKNLRDAGFQGWTELILKGKGNATENLIFKSKIRSEYLVKQNKYRIWGSSGDQWCDLLGNATAERSFKLPNPLYYVP